MGWHDLVVRRPSPLFPLAVDAGPFYFAHGFHFQCVEKDDVLATIDYGGSVVAAVQRGQVYGVQFHPEKSQDAGLDLLHGFVTGVVEAARAPAGGEAS